MLVMLSPSRTTPRYARGTDMASDCTAPNNRGGACCLHHPHHYHNQHQLTTPPITNSSSQAVPCTPTCCCRCSRMSTPCSSAATPPPLALRRHYLHKMGTRACSSRLLPSAAPARPTADAAERHTAEQLQQRQQQGGQTHQIVWGEGVAPNIPINGTFLAHTGENRSF